MENTSLDSSMPVPQASEPTPMPAPESAPQTSDVPPVQNATSRMKSWIKIGLLVAVVLGGVNGFLYWQRLQARDRGGREAEEANLKVAQIQAKRSQQTVRPYRNNDLKFALSYPGLWRYDVCEGSGYGVVGFGTETPVLYCNSDAPLGGWVSVSVSGSSNNLGDYIKEAMAGLDDAVREDITLGGKPAARVTGFAQELDGHSLPAGTRQIMIFAIHDTSVYVVSYHDHDGIRKDKEFDALVASFEFLP